METEDLRGRNAWRMKRQGSSSERKRARIPSGKAGAEGAGRGGAGRGRSPTSLPGRAGGALTGGLIAISLGAPSATRSVIPALNTWKRVPEKGGVARVALLWSQMCGFESRRHHVPSWSRVEVG